MGSLARPLAAVLSMIVGCAGVFGLLYYMNELINPPEREAKKVASDFVVERKPKKKKQRPKKQERPKPKRAAKPVRTAPTPNVMTSLSGLSFDLPQFENTQFTNTDQLLGAAGANKKLVMTEETVDALPKPRNRITPEYPAKARQRGVQGHVLLKIKVSERGDVERVKVVDAEPPGVFDMVAVAAIRQWTFDPATYKGEPVAISVQQRIPFRLN